MAPAVVQTVLTFRKPSLTLASVIGIVPKQSSFQRKKENRDGRVFNAVQRFFVKFPNCAQPKFAYSFLTVCAERMRELSAYFNPISFHNFIKNQTIIKKNV